MTDTRTVTITEAVLEEVLLERQRQIITHRYDQEHDDAHDWGELAVAAVVYVDASLTNSKGKCYLSAKQLQKRWPWDSRFKAASSRRSNLLKAVAMLVAEIERLDRVQS